MKRWWIVALGLLLSVGAFAQAGTGYFAILPGYQFSTGNYEVKSGDFWANGSSKNNFMGSLDFGWFFTDHVGLHVAYVYDNGDYHYNFHYGPYYFGDFALKRQVNIGEIGPEFLFGNKANQGYVQLNAGYTFGGGTTYYYYGGQRYNLGNLGDNTFIYGAAIGYRHYFNDTVGMAIQAAYHHANNWEISDMWDARIGLTVRFPKPAPPPPPPPPPPPRMIEINLDESVLHFKVNKWDIPKDGEPVLDDVVKKLNEYPTMRVNITGHTDSTGTAAWNATLSKHRADSIHNYLTKHGLAASRVDIVKGVGPKEPIADNKTKEGRAKNRRVQIVAVEPVKVKAS